MTEHGHAPHEVEFTPTQSQGFAFAPAGQGDEARCGDCWRPKALLFGLSQSLAEHPIFGIAQSSLAPAAGESGCAMDRIVGSQASADAVLEDRPKQSQCAGSAPLAPVALSLAF